MPALSLLPGLIGVGDKENTDIHSVVLKAPAFTPLPVTSITPRGWLANQLRLQADGLSGHLDEFWPDVQESAWIGGKAEGWERMPYWLDGVIPLAWLLGDEALQGRIQRYLDFIITHQGEDGWLGPRIEDVPWAADLWSQLLAMKMLLGYYDATQDARVPGAVERALRKLDQHIDRPPLHDWGQFRWFEGLLAVWWLYERTPEPWLINLAVKLHAQGFDWSAFFERWPLTTPTPKGRWNFMGHVVNNAMALKAPALWWRLTGAERDRVAASDMIAKLDAHHGMVTGVFSGDECLAGSSPIQGTELCAVVEYLFSLEMLLSVFGDAAFGDRLEKIAFNALPATFSPDMWAHQYDQQVNQVECSIRENRPWNTNGPEANIFGLEPNYGCCTANLSQGWPKFAAHLWMHTADEGLAAVAYAPNQVKTSVRNVPVTVTLDTEYPFRETLRFTVVAQRRVRFPLLLRIPAWAEGAELRKGDEVFRPQPGSFFRLEQEWFGATAFTLTLPMATSVTPRPRGAVAVERGPLVYALPIGEDRRRVNADMPGRELPHADWEVFPTTPWNYALCLHKGALRGKVAVQERPVGDCPFSPCGAPVALTVTGCRVSEWGLENGSAQETPIHPQPDDGSETALELVPYGCTNLRVTEFPVVEDN